MADSESLGVKLRERWRMFQCNYPAVQMALSRDHDAAESLGFAGNGLQILFSYHTVTYQMTL